MTTPEWTAGPPSSEMKTWQFSSPISSSPSSVWRRIAIWFAIVAVGTKIASSWPEQVRTALLELVDRRILAPLLVADRRGSDRRAHARGRPGGGVRAEVDHGS